MRRLILLLALQLARLSAFLVSPYFTPLRGIGLAGRHPNFEKSAAHMAVVDSDTIRKVSRVCIRAVCQRIHTIRIGSNVSVPRIYACRSRRLLLSCSLSICALTDMVWGKNRCCRRCHDKGVWVFCVCVCVWEVCLLPQANKMLSPSVPAIKQTNTNSLIVADFKFWVVILLTPRRHSTHARNLCLFLASWSFSSTRCGLFAFIWGSVSCTVSSGSDLDERLLSVPDNHFLPSVQLFSFEPLPPRIRAHASTHTHTQTLTNTKSCAPKNGQIPL